MGRNDRQADFRSLLAADHLDDLAQLHADDINRLGFPLADGDDLVPGMQLAGHFRGSSGKEALNDAIAVDIAQLGPDTDQGVADLDVELLGGIPGEEIAVRIVELGQRGEEDFLHVVDLDLVEVFLQALAALGEALNGAVERFVLQQLEDEFMGHSLIPEAVRLLHAGRPRGVLAVGEVHLVALEVEGPGEAFLAPGQAGLGALDEEVENLKGRVEVPDVEVGGFQASGETVDDEIDILLEENHARTIEALDVLQEQFLGIDLGEALLLVVIALDKVDGVDRLLLQAVPFTLFENDGAGEEEGA